MFWRYFEIFIYRTILTKSLTIFSGSCLGDSGTEQWWNGDEQRKTEGTRKTRRHNFCLTKRGDEWDMWYTYVRKRENEEGGERKS
jgi:hypothetical protein